MSDRFYREAASRVASAPRSDVDEWAAQWLAESLRGEARQRALAVERAAESALRVEQAKRIHAAGLAATERARLSGDRFYALSERRQDAHRIVCRLGGQDTRHPERWDSLTTEQREIIVACYPFHLSIDKSGVEWRAFESSEFGSFLADSVRDRDAREAARSARNDELRRLYECRAMLEWLPALLDSEFALADGSRIKWGDATIKDHESRVAMLQANAVANIEARNRHDAAILALAESGAMTLREMSK